MAHQLSIPSCILTPNDINHLPPIRKPLRINIEGPTVSIEKLLPGVSWQTQDCPTKFPQPAGPPLADLTYRAVYGQAPASDADLVLRDEYLGWIRRPVPTRHIDYYGVTFDHCVPENDEDPEVLQINIFEMDDDDGAYARAGLLFPVDPRQYAGVKILAAPRCCQRRRGKTDRRRVNNQVFMRLARDNGVSWEAIYKTMFPEQQQLGSTV
ncbi:hypothetical protein LLEC1_05796 [Akanthomyces lecanii]|uniref:Uncharacterized protein n=1 Tax=Cordyceps confragosa TaxID=2714763 RepID=A0A179IA51_CORDF|nr:hypothetical protein LLEC1_05796 [Akanthomyces lecanii]